MQMLKKFSAGDLRYEYQLDGIRTFPWDGIRPPFGGAYCIVRPHTSTLEHVNSPDDEDEMFIAIDGRAKVLLDGEAHDLRQGDIVMIPRGVSHCLKNDADEPFHFYTVWWNKGDVAAYLNNEKLAATE